jgi:hypothetical protein
VGGSVAGPVSGLNKYSHSDWSNSNLHHYNKYVNHQLYCIT